jgi:adenylate/nucleoside-diphosphate kinase
MKSEISETYENDTSLISGVTEKLEELMIPCLRVMSSRKPHIVRYLLTKKLHSIVQCRHSMFERVYNIKPRIAEKLLSCGYKKLSRFGRWCPVKLMDDCWMPTDYSSGVPSFPAIYRQHIYFMSSADARNQFALNPLAYLCQPSPKPVVPIRIAIIGPPKSGKSTLARRFAEEFGVMRLSIGEALRWVLSNQPNTELSKCIQSYLLNGLTVPDECAVQALAVVLMSKVCRTRGYVLDGFPVKKIQLYYMEQHNIIPVKVIELQINGNDCADRATADRYSKDR